MNSPLPAERSGRRHEESSGRHERSVGRHLHFGSAGEASCRRREDTTAPKVLIGPLPRSSAQAERSYAYVSRHYTNPVGLTLALTSPNVMV